MTAAIVVSLTIFAFVTKGDFTIFGGLIFIIGAVMSVFCIFVWVFNCYYLNQIYCALCVILFGLYLVFDT